ncbi:MAG: GNAT family N-acetyltransferase [Alphaproteobacteria bacterium]|nr:GNAT family N-acetyltransferase [Alphaproteobacteria bacterium]MCD8519891.1 GNAT family N-acetyltransferase [Alphaproteobacteria bacterium]MCD8526136.1 GNAT family N-acetyltransferase [Alphaproteobacteria bacterium]
MLIRPLEPDDYAEWVPLWDANNLGQINGKLTTTTWSRLSDPSDTQMNGMAAFDNAGHIVGIMHYILHPTTGSLQPACYMQDLFVMPAHRGKGIAKKLVRELETLGKEQKWARIYWLADNTNREAMALYRNLGIKLNFGFYVLPTGLV